MTLFDRAVRLALALVSVLTLATAARAQQFLTTTIVPDASIVYRDYNSNGVPSSGPYNPKKSDIRQLDGVIGNAITQLYGIGASGAFGYSTLAAIHADLAHPAGTIGTVFSDGANNGVYLKSGSSGSGSWARVSTSLYGLIPTWTVGTVTQLDPGTTPTVLVAGSPASPIFNFGLPGTQSFSVGSVTTASSGTPAAVTIGGTTFSPTFNFVIPRGVAGNNSFAWTGAWSPSSSYLANDVVFNNGDGSTYIAVNPNTNVSPVNGATWNVMTRGIGLNISANDTPYVSNLTVPLYGLRFAESGNLGVYTNTPAGTMPSIIGDYTNPTAANYSKHFMAARLYTLSNAGVITNAVNNGAGHCRLTIPLTSYMTTGDLASVSGITGATGCNTASAAITVVNSTTIDLPSTTFGGTYTSTTAGSFAVGQSYRIVSVGSTDFTAVGASANTVGIWFTATGVGSGTGTASSAQVVDIQTGGLLNAGVPLSNNLIDIELYTPPDNGGDSSGLTVIQDGGGNAGSFFNLCSRTPAGYTAYCGNGRAIEATVDGTKNSIVSQAQNGVAYVGYVTGGGIGLYLQELSGSAPSSMIDVQTSLGANLFYVDGVGGMFAAGAVGLGVPPPTNAAELSIGGGVTSGGTTWGIKALNTITAGATSFNAVEAEFGAAIVAGTGITIGAAIGVEVDALTKSGTGTVGAVYGLFVNAQTIGVNNYNYIGGNTGFGTNQTPTHAVDVGGTLAVSGAATALSINGLTITTTTGSLTVANGKTATDTSAAGANLLLGTTGGGFTAYGGTSCSSQVLGNLSAAGAQSCVSITNAFLTAGTFSSITGVGTLTAGATGAGFTIALGSSTVTGALSGVNGGTGLSTAAIGDLMYASATTPTWSRLADVATGSVLVSGGVGVAPAWASSFSAGTITASLTGHASLDCALSGCVIVGATSIAGLTVTSSFTATGLVTNADLTNSSLTLGSTNVALGATQTTLAGLSSVTSTTFVGALTGHASLDLQASNNLSDVGTKATAFNNLSPMTTAGDIIYGGASGTGTRLAAGASSQVLVGGASAPVWGSAPIAIGAPVVGGGTSGNILYVSGSIVGQVSTSGSGNVALTSGPSISGLTVTSSLTATGLVTVADLSNPSTTVNGQTCTLGSTCTITAAATSIVAGTTTVTGGPGVLSNSSSGGALVSSTTLPSGLTAPSLTLSGTIAGTPTWSSSQAITLVNALTFGTHLAAAQSSYNGSAAGTISTDASTSNVVSTIVARDAGGNFGAGTITATAFVGTAAFTTASVSGALTALNIPANDTPYVSNLTVPLEGLRFAESGNLAVYTNVPGGTMPAIFGDYTNPTAANYSKHFMGARLYTLSTAGVITNVTNNGSGHCRLTVPITSYMTTGDLVSVAGVTGATGCNTGSTAATVVNGTTIDLPATTFGGSYTNTSAGSFVVGQSYRIVSVGTTDFTLIGASANTVGIWFIATGVGSGSGTASSAQVVDIQTGSPLNAGVALNSNLIDVELYTPPDDGGDSSAVTAIQDGGGNAGSFFNQCSRTPAGYTMYCGNGRAIEATVDGSKNSVVSQANNGVAYVGYIAGTGIGLYIQELSGSSASSTIDVQTSGGTNLFYVDGVGGVYHAGATGLGVTPNTNAAMVSIGGSVSSAGTTWGVKALNTITAGATSFNATEFELGATIVAGTTIGAAVGLQVDAMTKSGGGTINAAYGLFVTAQTIGAVNYNVIGGNTGFGTNSAPTHAVDVTGTMAVSGAVTFSGLGAVAATTHLCIAAGVVGTC